MWLVNWKQPLIAGMILFLEMTVTASFLENGKCSTIRFNTAIDFPCRLPRIHLPTRFGCLTFRFYVNFIQFDPWIQQMTGFATLWIVDILDTTRYSIVGDSVFFVLSVCLCLTWWKMHLVGVHSYWEFSI